jgi:DNA invertase Pin-like site-specific DNA recombinase
MAKRGRAAIYTRVSTREQNDDLQLYESRDFVTRRGWIVVGEYSDHGESGAKRDRAGLRALLEDGRRGRYDVLVVWRSDRLFRSVRDMVVTLEALSGAGVDFVSVTEPFDTASSTGKLLFHLVTAFAQFERETMIERTVAGMAAAERRGQRMGRPTARVDIARAHVMRSEGVSEVKIARALSVSRASLRRAFERVQKENSK